MADPLDIVSWEGGLNTRKPPSMINDDQLSVAMNVEWIVSPLGERRRGTTAIAVGGAAADIETFSQLAGYYPLGNATFPFVYSELWAYGLDSGGNAILARKTDEWLDVPLTDAADDPGAYHLDTQMLSFRGKMFVAYKSDTNRLHVWDGTAFRRVGLAPPEAPTAADDGGSGSFSGVRYYRVRGAVVDGSTVLLRSEPSEEYIFTPSGSDTGAVVTRPSLPVEGETHWELEASVTSGSGFRRIARTALATPTVTDTEPYSTGYISFPLSADIGDYETFQSVRLLTVDEDRLIGGGNFEDPTLESTVVWSVVGGDVTGVGNDERVPLSSNNSLTLDANDGGGLTALIGGANGYVYAFKRKRIYRLTRTGAREKAYEAYPVSKDCGALPGSVVSGLDEKGHQAIFFLDPDFGPCIIGENGLQHCGDDIFPSWHAIAASTVHYYGRAATVYDAPSGQVRWIVWMDFDAGGPDLGIVLHRKHMRPGLDGYHRGLVLWDVPPPVWSACMFADNVDANTTIRRATQKPLYGSRDVILQANVGDDDNGEPFVPQMTSKSFSSYGLMNHFGCGSAVVLGLADADAKITVSIARNHGQNAKDVEVVFTPDEPGQSHVVKTLDNLNISEASTIDVTITDDGTSTRWELSQLSMKVRREAGQ